MAIGVRPDTDFIKNSGLALGPRGHILVDERLQTNMAAVYAVGDAVEVIDFVSGEKTAIPLAGPANRQGRVAMSNMAGQKSLYRGVQGTSILRVFDLTAAATGSSQALTEKAANGL